MPRSLHQRTVGFKVKSWAKSAAKAVIIGLALATAALNLLWAVAADSLVYPFAASGGPLPDGFVWTEWTAPDGGAGRAAAGLVADPSAPIVLFFMGNGGALGLFSPILTAHREAGMHTVAMAYRGGDGLPGPTSEALLARDARALPAALPGLLGDTVVAAGPLAGRVHAHGFSLGSGLALESARDGLVASVIIESAVAGVCPMVERATWGLTPACRLPWGPRWDNLARLAATRTPVLAVHGDADPLIPVKDGRKIGELVTAHGGAYIEIAGGGHGNLRLLGLNAAMNAWFVAHNGPHSGLREGLHHALRDALDSAP